MRLVYDETHRALVVAEETREKRQTVEMYATHMVVWRRKRRLTTVDAYTVWRSSTRAEALQISTAHAQTMITKDYMVTEKFVE